MEKQIYIHSYVKKDGTKVKEHYRNIDGRNTMIGNLPDIRVDENGGVILTGGVSVDDVQNSEKKGDVLGSIGGAIGTILDTISSACDVVEKLNEAFNQSNAELIGSLQPVFESQMQKVRNTQAQLEKHTQATLEKLVKTSDKQEYKNLFKAYNEQKMLNQELKNKIARIDYTSEHGNYSDLYSELKNYKSDFKKVSEQYRANNPLVELKDEPIRLKNSEHAPSPNLDDYILDNGNYLLKPIKGFLDSGFWAADKIGRASDADEMWKAFSHDFTQSQDYIEKNGNLVYSVSELPSLELQKIVSEKLQGQLGVSDALGVIFQPDSSISDAICKSAEFQKYFKENFNKFLDGKIIDKSSIHYSMKKNLNLGAALGNADILYSFIDKNGDFYSILMDTYDFNKNEFIFIEMARVIQEAKIGRGYYSLIIIKAPMSEWLQWFWL